MDLSGGIGPNGRGPAARATSSPLPPAAPRRRPDEPYRYPPDGRAPRRYRGLIIFLVIVVVAVTVGIAAWLYGSTHYQSMPDLTGLSKSAAEHALDNDGLKWKVTEVASQTVAAGEVASTDPPSGRPVADGATVTLDVSSGPARVAVPDVTGLSQSAATDKLTSLGFTVTVASQTQSSNVPSGEVAGYSPTGTATQGSTVTLVLSSGPGQAVVPDVTGMNIDDATAKLEGLGFHVVKHHVSMVLKTVIHQSPDGGQSTNQGGTVTLYY
jgi:serine/threonine-protein kinase